MKIYLIAAIGLNNELGKDNKLLFHLPKDFKYFKNKTWGLPIIMGRKTFDSMQQKALIGRINIIISESENKDNQEHHIYYVKNVQQALNKALQCQTKELFVIGGAKIYDLFLPLAHKLFITKVKAQFDADTFFPAINYNEWKLANNIVCLKDDKHLYDFEFQEWVKK